MSTSTAPVNLAWKDFSQSLNHSLGQIELFWVGTGAEGPTKLQKTSDFDKYWKVILDPSGSYVDELGRRVAVRRNIDDEEEANDVHWAAHNAAKFWFTMGATLPRVSGWNKENRPLSMVWRMQVRAMRSSCREEIRELALQEMIRMKAQADTRTTVVTPPNPYPYPGLLSDPSSIRLVVLLPAKEKHASIVCTLCNSTLSRSDYDQYEALSYVWGNSSKRRSITVNDRQFQATENLESALRNLRYRDRPRVLWIDSMCINQNDVTERNKQVQQMDCIYKKAQSVVVWLGPESDTSNIAFGFFQHGYVATQNSHDDQQREAFRKAVIASVQAIHHLAKRTWFTRIWCIQEFILGQCVVFQCGQKIAPWENFQSVLGFFGDTELSRGYIDTVKGQGRKFREQFIHAFPNLLKLFSWKNKAFKSFQSVLALLSEFREWSSSDPRDILFAFYGLVPVQDPDRHILQPDYSLNTSEVYVRFAVQYLQAHRELDILSVATHPVEDFFDISTIHFLPCWVPDWRDNQRFGAELQYRSIAYFGLGTHIFAFDKMYDAALGLKAHSLSFQDDSQILSLDGIEVDTIEDIGALFKGENHSYTDVCDILSEWKNIASLSVEGYYRYTGQPTREAFWRTILMDEELDISLRDVPQRSRIPPTDAKLDWFPHFPPSDEEDIKFLGTATTRTAPMIGRRFFKTSKGLIGLAPALAQKGDSVVVLFGGKAPFVLRKFHEWHHLVGESYVHGIMHGEIIHQPRTENFRELKVENFLLA